MEEGEASHGLNTDETRMLRRVLRGGVFSAKTQSRKKEEVAGLLVDGNCMTQLERLRGEG